jgi:segregation and condensation protein B
MAEIALHVSLLAILFVASEPLSTEQLSRVTDAPEGEVEKTLTSLKSSMGDTGICLSVLDGKYRLVSSPRASNVVKTFLQAETSNELSRAALETLAIVAYRGPITKSRVDAIRGVSSDTMLRNLQARGLILVAGKSEEPGRPETYAVSHTFLQHFGLTSTQDLPPLPEVAENED